MWGLFGVWANFKNVFVLFFLGGLLACVMEYIISYALEKMFHTRWWDYTRNRFNINGRGMSAGIYRFWRFFRADCADCSAVCYLGHGYDSRNGDI